MKEIVQWINIEGTGHYFFWAYPIILLALLVFLRGRRLAFPVPSLLITMVLINPWFYEEWNNLGMYAYWRLLWIVPVIPVTAALIPCITERINKTWIKVPFAAAGITLIVTGGTFLYNSQDGLFKVPSDNLAKLPEGVVEVSDYLLAIDDHPRAVIEYPLCTYIRQYTGNIEMLYGRNILGYILPAGSEAKSVHSQLINPEGDLNSVAVTMANEGYQYLVVNDAGREEDLRGAAFELVNHVGGYGIYLAHGTPTVIKRKNELGKVISVTTVDEFQNPVNGANGYATISYEYDDNGNVVREFRTDADGNGVADGNGFAGYEKEYDQIAHLIMERTIDAEGKAAANSNGYAEYRREYKGNNLIRESYFDSEGNPVNRKDSLYASVSMRYDRNRNRIEEEYSDIEGKLIRSYNGYAIVKRKYEGKRLVKEAYFDENSKPVMAAAGYSSYTKSYDLEGHETSIHYFGTKNEVVNCLNGYASDERQYDQEGNVIFQKFLDKTGKPVITTAGYAEVHRTYDENKHLTYEKYYNEQGEPYVQSGGHTAIRQEWDEDHLISRTYLDSEDHPMMRRDGYARASWVLPENGSTWELHLEDLDGVEVPLDGKNLAKDLRFDEEGWSEWMTPRKNTVNSCFNIGNLYLGPIQEGDSFTCQLEIEFRGVSATEGEQLRFWAQGAQDGRWFTGNVWNGNVVNLTEVPMDGIYSYSATNTVSGEMVNVSCYEIGFRCDYWASGSFRVRNLQIEKGTTSSEWGPGV